MATSGNALLDAATGDILLSQLPSLSTLGAAASGANSDITSLNAMNPLERILGFASGVDGTATGTTALYTVPASKIVFVTRALVVLRTVNTLTVAGIGNIGVTSADIIPATTYTSLTTAGTFFPMTSNTVSYAAVAADVINFELTTAFTATTATLDIILIGLEVPV